MTRLPIVYWALPLAATILGGAFGLATAPTSQEAQAARQEAYEASFDEAKAASSKAAFEKGAKIGRKQALRAALEAGSNQGSTDAESALAPPAPEYLCDPSFPTGCLQVGPGAGGPPCPPGTVPNADGGIVCAPLRRGQ